MDTCPYCGAETRQGDNFCLNCGNRLLPATPSPTNGQVQSVVGDATVAEPENWETPSQASVPSSGSSWGVDHGASMAAAPSTEPPTVREPAVLATAQATLDKIAEPGYFILRSDTGEVLQEYPLDKTEVVIGRAPTSEILLSKDKLTSRRHATVYYENNRYVLHDEHSANGTFVNGQQLEEATPYLLQDGDQVGIGEHELLFRAPGTNVVDIEQQPTISVPHELPANEAPRIEKTYSTRNDALQTIETSDDAYDTAAVEPEAYQEPVYPDYSSQEPPATPQPAATSFGYEPAPTPVYAEEVPSDARVSESEPVAQEAPAEVEKAAYTAPATVEKASSVAPSSPNATDHSVTFSRFSTIPTPSLPEMSSLMAALSSLDGQITSLQEQFNATQEAMQHHDSEIAQTASQLRGGIRRVSDRMDNMIADVARSREALSWAELLQLMEDVMNNPRDIEYVTKLARKARELNKVFQIHQNVLNTMAECNSLLRSLIGEEK